MNAPITVLASYHRRRGEGNPYTNLLERHLEPGARTVEFSWPRAFALNYDVFHIHWPEQIFRSRRPLVGWVKRRLLDALLVALRLKAIPIVRTLHNVEPHESANTAEQRLLARVDLATQSWIALNPLVDPDLNAHVILHGDYREWFAGYRAVPVASIAGRLLLIGRIRPYKGVESVLALAAQFLQMPENALSFRIAGAPATPQIERTILAEVDRTPTLSARLGTLEDAEMCREVLSSEAVLVPYARVENSGVALLALSLGRPVIATDSPSMRALQAEVGLQWVQLLSEPTAEEIIGAVKRLRGFQRTSEPDLSARSWRAAGVAHLRAYREALGRV